MRWRATEPTPEGLARDLRRSARLQVIVGRVAMGCWALALVLLAVSGLVAVSGCASVELERPRIGARCLLASGELVRITGQVQGPGIGSGMWWIEGHPSVWLAGSDQLRGCRA